MRVIDVHTHLGNAKDLVSAAKSAGIEFSSESLLQEMDKNNVEKVVVIAADFPGVLVRNEYVAKIVNQRKDRFVGIAFSYNLYEDISPDLHKVDLNDIGIKGDLLFPKSQE